MRRSVIVAIIVTTVLALSVGPALAQDKPDNKRGHQGHGHHKGHHKAAKKGSGNGIAKKRSGNGAAHIASPARLASDQTSNNQGNSGDSGQNVSLTFKGTLSQDGAQDSPLQVKVKKANNAAKSSVGQNLMFNVSSDTEIYRDNANGENSSLDAKITDLKAGDNVMIQADGAQDANGFTASLISAQPPISNTVAIPNVTGTPNTTTGIPNVTNGSTRLGANKNL